MKNSFPITMLFAVASSQIHATSVGVLLQGAPWCEHSLAISTHRCQRTRMFDESSVSKQSPTQTNVLQCELSSQHVKLAKSLSEDRPNVCATNFLFAESASDIIHHHHLDTVIPLHDVVTFFVDHDFANEAAVVTIQVQQVSHRHDEEHVQEAIDDDGICQALFDYCNAVVHDQASAQTRERSIKSRAHDAFSTMAANDDAAAMSPSYGYFEAMNANELGETADTTDKAGIAETAAAGIAGIAAAAEAKPASVNEFTNIGERFMVEPMNLAAPATATAAAAPPAASQADTEFVTELRGANVFPSQATGSGSEIDIPSSGFRLGKVLQISNVDPKTKMLIVAMKRIFRGQVTIKREHDWSDWSVSIQFWSFLTPQLTANVKREPDGGIGGHFKLGRFGSKKKLPSGQDERKSLTLEA
ncbi:hypothetical protein MPSEU_000764600 [Mayamaea pseudoterrestris]|nr:hypothetical protein MPSEU_000764600 [Mayamaea pseudoterrestris]